MKKRLQPQSAFFNPRVFLSFLLLFGAVLLAFGALGISPATTAQAQGPQQNLPLPPARPPLLTPDEAQRVAAGITQLVNQSSDGLVQVRRPDGGVSMDLQGRFQNVLVAKKESDGTVTQGCVDNPDTAAAFFEIDPALVGGKTRTAQSAPLPEKLPVR
jgi:hypothetical protein